MVNSTPHDCDKRDRSWRLKKERKAGSTAGSSGRKSCFSIAKDLQSDLRLLSAVAASDEIPAESSDRRKPSKYRANSSKPFPASLELSLSRRTFMGQVEALGRPGPGL